MRPVFTGLALHACAGQLAEVLTGPRLIEESVDGHILTQTLSSPCLDHELTRQRIHLRRLQRFEHHRFVERIAGHHLPVIEHRQAERLALSVRTQIRLKTERIDQRNVRLPTVNNTHHMFRGGKNQDIN
jgi:hypothetical protein